MINSKTPGLSIGAGALTAMASSLCCITPVIALIAGSSSVAANFSWIEPARPYLISLSIIILTFAWYVKLKPANAKEIDCECEPITKKSFLQSKTFLVIISAFALLMMIFPLYSKVFYPKPKVTQTDATITNQQQVKFTILGMTCEACEAHINNELSKIMGVVNYKTSYETRSSIISYDESKVNLKILEAAITKSGYKAKIEP